MDRWAHDPEFTRRLGPRNYLEGKEDFFARIKEAMQTRVYSVIRV